MTSEELLLIATNALRQIVFDGRYAQSVARQALADIENQYPKRGQNRDAS